MKLIGSASFQVNWIKVKKALRFFIVALVGAILTFLTSFLSGTDFVVTIGGKAVDLSVLVVTLWASLAEFIRRWLSDYSNTTDTVPEPVPDQPAV